MKITGTFQKLSLPVRKLSLPVKIVMGCGLGIGGLCLPGMRVQAQKTSTLTSWLTDPGSSVFFQKQKEHPRMVPAEPGNKTYKPGDMVLIDSTTATRAVITVDDRRVSQTIDGFGFALTGGSAQHIIRMSPASRASLLKELFSTQGKDIGTSYLRVSIGASDLNDRVFSYDDLPEGQVDTALTHFGLGPDLQDVVPVLKEILAINPALKILGSPWSPPAWMKDNHDTRGGSLLPEYYPVYARYFVRYILAMRRQGIRIDAITVQNEPLHPGNNPSLLMPAVQQGEFVKTWLGPAFRRAGIRTKIVIYDHNADKPEYPISILDDPAAAKYIDGSAFHLYGGKIEALSQVHNAHPDKNLYFTEQWVGGPGNFKKDIPEHIRKLIVGATCNWSRTVIEWNLAANSAYQPHTDRGGCDRCLGAVTIDGDSVKRNPAYYIIAHAAKLVRPGSKHIASEVGDPDALPNTAFLTPAGKIVLIVLNNTDSTRPFTIRSKGRQVNCSLNAGAVATYEW